MRAELCPPATCASVLAHCVLPLLLRKPGSPLPSAAQPSWLLFTRDGCSPSLLPFLSQTPQLLQAVLTSVSGLGCRSPSQGSKLHKPELLSVAPGCGERLTTRLTTTLPCLDMCVPHHYFPSYLKPPGSCRLCSPVLGHRGQSQGSNHGASSTTSSCCPWLLDVG